MGARGTKPIPNEIKKLKGTLRADRTVENEFSPTRIDGIPEAPNDLPSYAKKVWDRVCVELDNAKMLYNLDLILIKEYSYNVSILEVCRVNLEENGYVVDYTNKGNVTNSIKSPWITVYNEAFDKVLKISGRFGFSPSDRVKLPAPKPEDQSEFSKMLVSKSA